MTKQKQRQQKTKQPRLTNDVRNAMTDDERIEFEANAEMFGDDDAAYLFYAGIDDIGDK